MTLLFRGVVDFQPVGRRAGRWLLTAKVPAGPAVETPSALQEPDIGHDLVTLPRSESACVWPERASGGAGSQGEGKNFGAPGGG